MTDRSRLSALGARLSAPDDQLPQISQSPQMMRLRLLRLAVVVAERRELTAESVPVGGRS
jgi:hypothetical protein